jgi:hypothetical protein
MRGIGRAAFRSRLEIRMISAAAELRGQMVAQTEVRQDEADYNRRSGKWKRLCGNLKPRHCAESNKVATNHAP